MPLFSLHSVRFTLSAGILLLGASFFSPARAMENEDCQACHGQKDTGAPYFELESFNSSIHGKNLCVSCHADAAELPHPEKLAPVSCGKCHRVETQVYLNSDHGRAVSRGRLEAASCKDCHGHTHTLLNSRHPDSPVNRQNIVQTCARCHADAQRMARARLTEKDPLGSYNHTVHGEAFAQGRINAAVCSDCHGTHDLHGSLNPKSRIFKNNVPETCGRCHQNVSIVFGESIHGQAIQAGIKEAPICTDCHGEHTIRSPKDPVSPASTGAVTKTCTGCHDSERVNLKFGLPTDRLKTYFDTYHGLASRRGDLRVANCASCHGFHDIFPSTDPRSSIHKSNMSGTCGRCHPGAGHKLASGSIHGPPTAKHWAISAAKWFYVFVIPLTLGFMFFHNFADWLRKSLWGLPAHPAEESVIRLTVNERWQHALLMASFIFLAYTGFALKFSETTWVKVFAPFGEDLRRNFHRWSAVVFCALGAFHLLYLAVCQRGRFIFKEMWPRLADAVHLFQRMAYNVGLRREAPRHAGFYNYYEKIEYWSLVWGSLVMIVTGGVLVFNNFALKHFPAWASDLATLIHYYEAILACLAILIWHLYGVIFDPEVYPMNWSWIKGWRKWVLQRSEHDESEK
ncbi:MAG: cytochrome b/b6 domain-containing protein [Elusimicrobia bacterium]|nr:cytochrome b/b6 domain-containing protein [Elusimicrobiota bacterium]